MTTSHDAGRGAQCLTPGCRYSLEIKTHYSHSSYGNARIGITALFPEWKSLAAQTNAQMEKIERIVHCHMEAAIAEVGQYDLSLGGEIAKDWPKPATRPPEQAVETLPAAVARLVIAAREVFDAVGIDFPEVDALDKALEPFSELVPYENQPDEDCPPAQAGAASGEPSFVHLRGVEKLAHLLAWHHFGLRWEHLERASQAEITAACQAAFDWMNRPLAARQADLATPAASGEIPGGMVADFRRLHEAARGCEFDLTPADGAIARLTLFVHEHGDAIAAALSTPKASAETGDNAALVKTLGEYRRVMTTPFDPSKAFGTDYDRTMMANARKLAAAIPQIIAALSAAPSAPATEAGEYVAGPIWAEPEDECFTAEIQTIGGHHVVATVHGSTRDQAEQRQHAVLRALATPTDQVKDAKGGGA